MTTIEQLLAMNPIGFKRRMKRIAARNSQSDLAVFIKLESIDAETKTRVLPAVRSFIHRFYGTRGFPSMGQFVFLLVVMISVELAILVPLSNWIIDHMHLPDAKAAWIAAAGGAACYFSIFAVARVLNSRNGIWALLVYPATIVLFAAGMPYRQSYLSHRPWLEIAFDVCAGASIVGAFVTSLSISVIPLIYATAQSYRRNMDSHLFRRLLMFLSKIENKPRRWDELPFKVELISELEKIAGILQRDLPAQVNAGDESFNIWVRDRAWRTSAFLREMKKWVMVPRQDTRRFFIQQLTAILVCLAKGDWDGIPTVETSERSRRVRWLAHSLVSLRTLAGSVLPIAILVLLNRYGITPPDAMKPYVYLTAAVWLAVGCISLLDPLYASKFEAVKAALQFLPLGKKKE